LLAIPVVDGSLETAIIRDIAEAVESRDSRLWVGVSRVADDFASARREANACLRLAQRAGRPNPGVIRSDDLGPLRFVLGATNLDQANDMVRQQLGKLIEHDAESKSPLLPTLRAYLDADGHQPTVAAACFIHVSTLKYRMKKIRELLDDDLGDPDTRFQLKLSCKLMDLLEALDLDAQPA
jgi:DNA-binding PucR family transcriptional regulator